MASGSNLEAQMELKLAEFTAELARIQTEWGKQADEFVLKSARKLVKKWAFLAPIKTGRLRAGFWPAAIAMGVTNIYTSFENAGEGFCVLNLDTANPTITIVNSVPYVSNAGHRGQGWWFEGLAEVQGDLQGDLEDAIKAGWAA